MTPNEGAMLCALIGLTVWLVWLTRRLNDMEKHRVQYINKRIGDHGLRINELELNRETARKPRVRKAAK